MILVENILYKDEKKYIQVRVHTACCKERFIVEDQGKELLNLTTGEYVLWGMRESIRQSEKYYNEEMLKMRESIK